MQVTVVPYQPYRDELGSSRLELDVPDGSTLRDVLRRLARQTRKFSEYAEARGDEWLWGQLIVHLRGEMAKLDQPLRDGDCLELLPPISGG